jgi:hypothetical protein
MAARAAQEALWERCGSGGSVVGALWERARPAKGKQSLPAKVAPQDPRDLGLRSNRSFWDPAGWQSHPFAGKARSYSGFE